MLRICCFVFLACLMTACGYRSMPYEVTAMREDKRISQLPSIKRTETIIVDAGHGGKDTGAHSKKEAYEEKELTLSTAQMICNYLNKLGYKTLMTRSQDVFIPLEKRAEMANTLQADLFVSIHYNFCPSEDVEGIEVYYYKEKKSPPSKRIVESRQLGLEVLNKIVKQTGAQSRGLKQANFAVIRETTMPAILVEGGFLSNRKERLKLQDSSYRKYIATGIANGIDQYLLAKRTVKK